MAGALGVPRSTRMTKIGTFGEYWGQDPQNEGKKAPATKDLVFSVGKTLDSAYPTDTQNSRHISV